MKTEKNGNSGKKVAIRLHFNYKFLKGNTPGANNYKVYIDGKLVDSICHIDDTGGHKPLGRKYAVAKGIHSIKIEYKEISATGTFEKDFEENTGLLVSDQNNKLSFKEVPFDKVIMID